MFCQVLKQRGVHDVVNQRVANQSASSQVDDRHFRAARPKHRRAFRLVP
jgi:hypothetical protein